MKKLTRYKCSCGATDTKKKIEKCEEYHIKEKVSIKKSEKINREKNKIRDCIRLKAETFDDIKRLLIENVKEYLDVELVFTRYEMTFSEEVSNSHSCPINGVTNWSTEDDKPKGYPGWSGFIEGNINGNDKIEFGGIVGNSFNMDNTPVSFRGFHTGTGGYGNKNFYGGFSIFIDDFPKLKKKYEEWKIFDKKANTYIIEKNKLLNEYDRFVDDTIETDVKVIKLDGDIDKLNKSLKRREKSIIKECHKSKKKMTTLSKKFDFDKKEYLKLCNDLSSKEDN